MRIWTRVRSWLRAVSRRSRTESDMDTELRFHIQAYADDLIQSGVPPDEAARQARLAFGGVDRAKSRPGSRARFYF